MKEKIKKMKIKNLIDESNKTKYNIFMLIQIDKDKKEIESLLQSLDKYKAELEQIKVNSQVCTDIREIAVIKTHYDNAMNKIHEYNNRYEKLIARCKRREKILKEQKGW